MPGRGWLLAACAFLARLLPGDAALQSAAWAETSYSALPLAGSVVTHGSARFTVLSDSLLRLEWSPHTPPRFHEAGTYFAVNRLFPSVPTFTSSVQADGSLRLQTSALTLEYAGGELSKDNLVISLASGVEWHPGDAPLGSLHGTIRTLDRVGSTVGLRCSQPAYRNDSHCEEGPLSTSGWAVIDDSLGPRWDTTNYAAAQRRDEWPWVTGPAESPASASGEQPPAAACAAQGFERFECIWGNVVDEGACAARGCCFDAAAAAAADGQPPANHFIPWCFWPQPAAAYTDLYFFGHGADYVGALRDYTALAGRVPLMPRWALGPHFSRWFAFTDEEEREVLATHARLGIPLDVQACCGP